MNGNRETNRLEAEGIEPMLERTPTVLLLDTSGSMAEATQATDGTSKPKIAQLNEGLETFHREVSEKEHAKKRVDVAVVTFGDEPFVTQEFTSIEDWTPSTLSEGGRTPMGGAIELAIELVDDRKEFYRENGIQYNRPLLWLLTDGEPTDMQPDDSAWNTVQGLLEDGTRNNRFEFFAMGVGGAQMDTLNELVAEPTGRPAFRIKEGMFLEYFQFLSNSLETASDPASGDSFTMGKEQQLEQLFQVE